ncbi:unnamed protein product [Prorocentrum cordatum]|uniref:RING-type domain-containing protein n=1 Tax=Prorocentrum cordatum TaxID=2364126 RepID=A0ABN9W8J7_9DINO|nr:unnamed protein product [Polarella glacialis]
MGPRSMAAEAALARAERAARQAVRRADARGEDFQEAEPTGSVHAVRLLRATSQLRAHTGLHDLREAQERHLDSLDRQMREVELTRELVAKALESSEPSLPPGRARRAPRAAGRPARLPSAGGAAPELSAEEQPKRAPARAESTPALPAGTAGTPAGRARGQCRLVELRPAPCPPGAEGQDCPCCLSAMEAGQPVLAFPCAAPHHFHARCLDAGCALPAGGAPAPCAGAGREAAGRRSRGLLRKCPTGPLLPPMRGCFPPWAVAPSCRSPRSRSCGAHREQPTREVHARHGASPRPSLVARTHVVKAEAFLVEYVCAHLREIRGSSVCDAISPQR